MQGPFWNEFLNELLGQLPFWMYGGSEIDLKLLFDAAWQQIEARFYLDRQPQVLEHWRKMMETDVEGQIFENLRYLGAVEVQDGKASLTPLGL